MFEFGFEKKKPQKIFKNISNKSDEHRKIQTVAKSRKKTIFNNIQLAKSYAYANMAIMEKIQQFCDNSGKIYITFGGVGDLLLLLAECYKDLTAKVIFFANGGSDIFGKKFLDFFNINYFLHPNIMGGKIANRIIEYLQSTGRLAISAHLADNLDFDDYKINPNKYKQRMIRETSWKNEIGLANEFSGEKLCVICPSGSSKTAWKQRYLEPSEHETLVNFYLSKGYFVISTGSEKDQKFYTKIVNKKHYWLTANYLFNGNKKEELNGFHKFLQIINCANLIVSVDTWLKTYTALAGLETKVIQNRFNGVYEPVGFDPSDFIFMNEDFFPTMKIVQLQNLVLQNCSSPVDAECKQF